MRDTDQTRGNDLLAALPPAERARIFPYLQRVMMLRGMVLHESGDVLRYVSDSAEISVVGNDGLVGVPVFMCGGSTPSRALVQISVFGYRLIARRLQEEFRRQGRMQILLLRYTQSLLTQMAQTAVCNRLHSVDQQLCRWLLLSLDRIASNQMRMTQELIANMLGVRREGVTIAAAKLQKLGAIRYSRGIVTVLNRQALEHLCCECYAVVKRETDRLRPKWC
jgi:hypothetical protein